MPHKNIIERLRATVSEAMEDSHTIDRLTEIKEDVAKTIDLQIEKLEARSGLVRKIKLPKIKFNWRYLVSVPFIYGIFFPAVIFHFGIEIYHQVCFRLYKIPVVDAKKYFIYDRQLLSLLNPIDKLNCLYCSYVNNLIRYSAEIGARTERYWCPIKYYRRVNDPHSQYEKFVEVGDASDVEEFKEKWEKLRDFSDIEKKS